MSQPPEPTPPTFSHDLTLKSIFAEPDVVADLIVFLVQYRCPELRGWVPVQRVAGSYRYGFREGLLLTEMKLGRRAAALVLPMLQALIPLALASTSTVRGGGLEVWFKTGFGELLDDQPALGAVLGRITKKAEFSPAIVYNPLSQQPSLTQRKTESLRQHHQFPDSLDSIDQHGNQQW